MEQLISRKAFAELAGVHPGSVTRAAKSELLAATVGSRIDVTHQAAQNYLQKRREIRIKTPEFLKKWEFCHSGSMPPLEKMMELWRLNEADARRLTNDLISVGVKPPAHVRGTAAARAERLQVEIREVPAEIAKLTAPEIAARFGNEEKFHIWVKINKDLEAWRAVYMKNAVMEGKLVSCQIVQDGILDPFDALFLKLLSDGVKTIARRAHAFTQAGKSVEDLEALVMDQVGSFIRPVKDKVKREVEKLSVEEADE